MIACILSGMSATMSWVSCDNACMLCCELFIAGMLLTGIITAVEWQFILMCDFLLIFCHKLLLFSIANCWKYCNHSSGIGYRRGQETRVIWHFDRFCRTELQQKHTYITSMRLNRIDSTLQFTVSRISILNMPGFWRTSMVLLLDARHVRLIQETAEVTSSQ